MQIIAVRAFELSRCAQESEPSISNIRFHAICLLSFLAVVTAASKRITTAKALLVLVVVVAAAAMLIEAADHDKSKSESFSLKILLLNMARDDVTLKLLANQEPLKNYISANMNTVLVVAQTGQSAASEPFMTASSVVQVSVTVENRSSVPVKKMLAINLLKYFRCTVIFRPAGAPWFLQLLRHGG